MALHIAILVEEPSMEAFLHALLPRLLPQDRTFEVHAFQGKADLMKKLESRLRAYANWLPAHWRLMVLVDRDDEDCKRLKERMEIACRSSGLRTRTEALVDNRLDWQVVNRIAIEELEAWYFGDWEGVRNAFPKVSPNVPKQQGYRDPDAIAGGTWEAFERVLRRHGYYKPGLAKIDAARTLGQHIEATRNISNSFAAFHRALLEAFE